MFIWQIKVLNLESWICIIYRVCKNLFCCLLIELYMLNGDKHVTPVNALQTKPQVCLCLLHNHQNHYPHHWMLCNLYSYMHYISQGATLMLPCTHIQCICTVLCTLDMYERVHWRALKSLLVTNVTQRPTFGFLWWLWIIILRVMTPIIIPYLYQCQNKIHLQRLLITGLRWF